MNDFADDLTRVRQEAARAARLRSGIDGAAPARSEGTDRSGVVAVVLGPDGLPETIQVHARWRERLAAGSFAAAVAEACQAAMRERGAAWARALDSADWQRQLVRFDLEPAEQAPQSALAPEAFRRYDGGPLPSVLGVAEDVISAFDAAMAAAERARAEPPRGTGINAERTVALTLSPGGRVACRADARWVHRQTGPALSSALGQALAAARQNLGRASGSEDAARHSAHLKQLMQEIRPAGRGMARPNET
jgi:hypothetical protein